MTVFSPNDFVIIPDSVKADSILKSFHNFHLDVNLPEFKLRIMNDSVTLFTIPIRIGQNKSKY